jgi:CO/xanthine dehydrogenase Mo-binding subunit
MDVLKAMKGEPTLLHEDLFTDELGEKSSKPSNVASHQRFQLGEVAKGFAAADHILEQEYRCATVHQGYIEPHAATAMWNADGFLTIWCTTQGAFTVRGAVHQILDIPVSKLKVIPRKSAADLVAKSRFMESLWPHCCHSRRNVLSKW